MTSPDTVEFVVYDYSQSVMTFRTYKTHAGHVVLKDTHDMWAVSYDPRSKQWSAVYTAVNSTTPLFSNQDLENVMLSVCQAEDMTRYIIKGGPETMN